MQPRRWYQSSAVRALFGLVLGLIVGIAIASSGSPAARSFAKVLEPIGTIWVNAIRMTIVPLVASLLISTLASTERVSAVGKMGARALSIFIALLSGVAILALLLGPPLMQAVHIDPAAAASLRESAAATKQPELPTFASWVVSLVPANPIKAAADGAMLPVIVFAVVFALALGRLAPSVCAGAITFFGALAEAMLVIVHWVLAVAPIGVFALTVPLALRIGASVVGAVAFFLLVHCGLLVVLGALFYLVAATLGRQPLGRFARAALPAQIVAVSTRSSVAALPAMIDGAERVLGIPPAIAGFGLPFAISMFRVNTPLSWIVSGLFIAELYGVPLGMSGVAIIGAGGVLMSLSVPGIPSGGLFILAPLFLAVGLPVEGIGILIALDAIPDMFKTTVIVTGDLAATALLARSPLPATEMIAETVPTPRAPHASADAVVSP
jgi:proton glutamate symport protein